MAARARSPNLSRSASAVIPSLESSRASRVARDRAAPTGSGRRAYVLGTAAVRVSVLRMSWLIPWSGRCDHPGRFLSFHVALQHGRLTEAERAPVLKEALIPIGIEDRALARSDAHHGERSRMG